MLLIESTSVHLKNRCIKKFISKCLNFIGLNMSEQQQLKEFLGKIQLDQFLKKIVELLHVTRLEHFEHVIDTDLQNIGMTMPEIRRLFDQIRKNKKKFFISKLKKSFRKSYNIESDSINLQPDESSNQYLSSPKHEAKCLIQTKDIKFIEVIGKGAFGSVRSAEWTIQDNEKVLVAVKCIRRTNSNRVEDVQSEVVKEANAMSYLNHPNLIRFFGVLISTPMMLVTELAPLGTLLKRLRQESDNFQISILCSYVVQIAAGMKYLEKNKIVHRDLAARNILLMSYEKVKIGDFGLARPLDHDTGHYVMHPDGLIPFAWCAPECLKFKRFSHASDVWAFGITACELFTYGTEPWAGLNGAQILERICEPYNERPPCPDYCPREIYSILCGHCWNYDEIDRPEFNDLEKLLLSVLPIELRAVGCLTATSINNDMLQFTAGDLIAVFNTNSVDGIWKGQNRRTGQVGFITSSYVDFANGTISTGNILPKINDYADTTSDDTSARSTMRCEGFANKLWNLWDEEKDSFDNDVITKPQTSLLSAKLTLTNAKDCDGCANSVGSGFGGACSSMGSYCEDCLSQNSVDSGCLCRCSTYSSDSSTQRYSTDIAPLSKPITIPGSKASVSRPGTAAGRRCSSCCSSSNRHSVFSDTLDRDVFNSSPLSNSPARNGSDMDELCRNTSQLRIPYSTSATVPLNGKQKELSGSEGSSKEKSFLRRRSLPDLANPRKRNLLGRSLRLRKRKELVTTSSMKSKDDISYISAPSSTTGTKFYLPGKDAVISDVVSTSLESRISCPLYDLVPIRNRNDENAHQISHDLEPSAHYSQPRSIFSAAAPTSDDNRTPFTAEVNDDSTPFATSTARASAGTCGLNKEEIAETYTTNDIYENVCVTIPIAPPRRKKRQSNKRHSMFELSNDDVIRHNGSPTPRQCVILDGKYETEYYSNVSL